MPWTWVRPADPTLLEGRPLLDLGTGDGQTLAALITGKGLVVGLDRSETALKAARHSPLTVGIAGQLPFRDGAFAVVLAADLFHHLDDPALERTIEEVRRVLRPDGLLVAWWYEHAGRPSPDSPRFPRPANTVAAAMHRRGYTTEDLALEMRLEPAPATVGLLATR